ncbi:MerR family transcriptional regulator [Deinococcus oregonensis]|uniref:MerR family transcriptional regulator n=1 Tax=Deinococcus oregonensis TaxID=1805970 RepID=A0ABV6B564_9DEIO
MNDSGAQPILPEQDSTAMFTASEVSARTGVLAVTLRQWERRYGFPSPARSESGYRLYSPQDLARIEVMQAFLRDGVPAGRAAELTVRGFLPGEGQPTDNPSTSPAERERAGEAWSGALLRALMMPDMAGASRILAEAQLHLSVEDVLLGVMAPALVSVGELWARGEITIAHEHHASAFLRSRITALLDSEGESTTGPLLVAACAPGEQHELGLMMLVLVLRRRGVRVTYLGANTPLGDLAIFARQVRAQGVLLAMNGDWALDATRGQWTDLNDLNLPLFLGGGLLNARPEVAALLGGIYAGPDAAQATQTILARLSEGATNPPHLARDTQVQKAEQEIQTNTTEEKA